jgi:flavin-dependent dehydrogenase
VDAEIAIVGGGPAGASTALFLSALAPDIGKRTVVLDKARFPRDKICAGAVGGRADKLLAGIGAGVRVPERVVHGLRVETRAGVIEMRLPGGEPVGRVVRRVEFDDALLALAREAGAEVREGVTVRGFRRDESGVVLDTSDGPLRARCLVGADGVGSVVRRGLGLDRGVYYAQAVEVDTASVAGDPAEDLLSFDVSDGFAGYTWDFPTIVDGEPLVCRGVYKLTRGVSTAANDASDVGTRLLDELRVRGLSADRCRLRRFAERGLVFHEPCAADRVLLAGEAAGIDPFLGEGIAQAIFYGKTAASYLVACARRRDYRFTTWRRVLARSRVGLDLRVRRWAVHFFYGRRSRMLAERFTSRSRHFALAGLHYFAGLRVPRARLLAAAADLARAAVG